MGKGERATRAERLFRNKRGKQGIAEIRGKRDGRRAAGSGQRAAGSGQRLDGSVVQWFSGSTTWGYPE